MLIANFLLPEGHIRAIVASMTVVGGEGGAVEDEGGVVRVVVGVSFKDGAGSF